MEPDAGRGGRIGTGGCRRRLRQGRAVSRSGTRRLHSRAVLARAAGQDRRRHVRGSWAGSGARPAHGGEAALPARMLDTAHKTGGRLLDHIEYRRIERFRRCLPPAWPDGRPRRLARGAGYSAPSVARAGRPRIPRRACAAITTGRRGSMPRRSTSIRALIPVDLRGVRAARRASRKGRLSSARGARLCGRSAQGRYCDGSHPCARFRAAGSHRHLQARARRSRRMCASTSMSAVLRSLAMRRRTCATCSPTT